MPDKTASKNPGLIICLPLQGWIGRDAPKALFLAPSREIPMRNPHRVLFISTPEGKVLQYVLCGRAPGRLLYREAALAS